MTLAVSSTASDVATLRNPATIRERAANVLAAADADRLKTTKGRGL